jgi:hypothetical protein
MVSVSAYSLVARLLFGALLLVVVMPCRVVLIVFILLASCWFEVNIEYGGMFLLHPRTHCNKKKSNNFHQLSLARRGVTDEFV